MRQLRTIFLILTTTVLAAAAANAQVNIGGSGGTVTTDASGLGGVPVAASNAHPDVAVSTGNTSPTSAFHIFNSSSTELLRVQSDGKVGIGTPPSTLSTLAIKQSGAYPAISIQEVSSTGRASIGFSDPAFTGGWVLGQSSLQDRTRDFYLYDLAAAQYRLLVDANGNVGIGAPPGYKLDVSGVGNFSSWVQTN